MNPSKRLRSASPAFFVAASVLSAVTLLIGCGGTSGSTRTDSTTRPTTGFAELSTRRCPTFSGVELAQTPLNPTTVVPMSRVLGLTLTAYRDSAGTTLVAPNGYRCKAGIGTDGSETIEAYPKSLPVSPSNGLPPNLHTGPGVSLQSTPACQGCIASTICSLLPNAKVVREYRNEGALQCRPKPVREQVGRFGQNAVVFTDPPGVSGQGNPSGGSYPAYGVLAYSTYTGSTEVTCTLPRPEAEICPAIVSAALGSASR